MNKIYRIFYIVFVGRSIPALCLTTCSAQADNSLSVKRFIYPSIYFEPALISLERRRKSCEAGNLLFYQVLFIYTLVFYSQNAKYPLGLCLFFNL